MVMPAARAAEGLVGGGGDEMGVRERRGMHARGTRPAMWAMSAMSSAPTSSAISANLPNSIEARIGAGAAVMIILGL